MTAALVKIRAEYQAALTKAGIRQGSMPPAALQLVRAANAALSEAEAAINNSASRVPQVLGDRRIYPEGRKDAAKAAITALRELVQSKADTAQSLLSMAKTTLENESLRPLNRAEELTARQDALMILDRTAPNQRDVVMSQLATRQDAIGSVVSSSWGRDYLSTVTPDPALANAMHSGIRTAAIDAAKTQNVDEARRDASRHIDTLPVLHGMRDAVAHTGRMVADELTEGVSRFDARNSTPGSPAPTSAADFGLPDSVPADAPA
ncbi:MAG: hypothetical protein ACRDQJ_00880 [Pseudonocardiaceae bacterium]